MFLIYLKSQSNYQLNAYGFYTGETYQNNFETYPICVESLCDAATKGKLYKSRKVAEKVANNLVEKCIFVSSYQIIELPNEPESATKNI